MRRLTAALCLMLLARPALAQTGDEARITLGVTGGLLTGGSLWTVNGQPFTPPHLGASADTFNLARSLSTSFTFGLTSSYFPTNHLGVTGEIALLGLGSKTSCKVTATTGFAETRDLCNSLGNAKTSSSTVALSLGGIFRVASRQDVSPFISAKIGAMISEESIADLSGTYLTLDSASVSTQQVTVPIFNDPGKTRVDIYGQVGAGFTFNAGHGYQLRLEARDNYVRLPVPTGPGQEISGNFTKGRVGKHLFSVIIGFDIILEQKRGRRY